MAELTDRCLHYAMLERGPTQLNIPRDMFYGDVDAVIKEPSPVERPPGGAEALNKAAQLLAAAANPVIVAGESVRQLHRPSLRYNLIFISFRLSELYETTGAERRQEKF